MMAISYSLDNTLGYGGSIGVYMRNKTYGVWIFFETITDANENFCKIFENEITSTVGLFHECEVRLVLNADGEFSPIMYEATLIYEDNLKA